MEFGMVIQEGTGNGMGRGGGVLDPTFPPGAHRRAPDSRSFFSRILFPVPSCITIPNPIFLPYKYIEKARSL